MYTLKELKKELKSELNNFLMKDKEKGEISASIEGLDEVEHSNIIEETDMMVQYLNPENPQVREELKDQLTYEFARKAVGLIDEVDAEDIMEAIIENLESD